MANRGGGLKHKSKVENNIYFNRQYADIVFEYLKTHYDFLYRGMIGNTINILDCCAGNGILGESIYNIIKPNHKDTKLTLLDNRMKIIKTEHECIKQDIFNYNTNNKFDIIVCNPPWIPVDVPEAIYHRLIKMLNDRGMLFFIINNTFCYQGVNRAKDLIFQKYYFLPRYTFFNSGKKLLDCGILVYHKSYYSSIHISNILNNNCFINLPRPGEIEPSQLNMLKR